MQGDYAVKVSSDVTDFNKGMDSAVESTEKLQKTADDASKSIDDLGKKGARSAKELLDEMKNMEKGGRSVSNYRRQLSKLTREIQDLTINYSNMSKEMQNSDIGRETVLKIQELTKEAGKYKDAIQDAQASISALASDTQSWDAMKQGIGMVSGALQGIASTTILGADSTEKLVRVIAKLKTVEAATNSVIQIGNALQKQSALMTGIARIQSAALAKAKIIEAAAIGKATIAQRLFNTVAKSNPYILLASAIIAIGGAVAGWMAISKQNNSVQANAVKIQENLNKKLKETQREVGDTIGKFKYLENSYKELKSTAEKQEWIKEHQKEFSELGLVIEDVNTADDAFIKNSAKIIEAMKLRAEAAAVMSLYEEEYAKAYKKSLELQDKAAHKSARLAGPRAWKKEGLKEGIDYERIDPQEVIAKNLDTNWRLTPEGEKKMEAAGKKVGDAYMEGVDESLSPLIKLVGEKTEQAMKLESQVIAYNNAKNDKNTKVPKGSTDLTKEYTSQLDILKAQKKTLEDGLHYIDEGTDKWKAQLYEINECDKKIKALEDAQKAYIASLNRQPIELVPTIDTSKLKLPRTVSTETKAEIRPVFQLDKLRTVLEDAEKLTKEINEKFKLGILDKATAQEMINNINKNLESKGIKTKVHLEVDTDDIPKVTEEINNAISSIDSIGNISSGIVGGINSIYESITNLNSKLNESKSGWESFFSVFEAGMTILQSITSILNSVAMITELMNKVKDNGIGTIIAETLAIKANTAAKLDNAGASAADAIASGAKSVADIPVVGWVMAIAAAGALLATLLSSMKQAKKFAGGGIVGGNSFVGDRVPAFVNSDEMILNKEQQNKLWKFIQNGSQERNVLGSNQIEFRVRGTDLVATLNNYTNRRSKI